MAIRTTLITSSLIAASLISVADQPVVRILGRALRVSAYFTMGTFRAARLKFMP